MEWIKSVDMTWACLAAVTVCCLVLLIITRKYMKDRDEAVDAVDILNDQVSIHKATINKVAKSILDLVTTMMSDVQEKEPEGDDLPVYVKEFMSHIHKVFSSGLVAVYDIAAQLCLFNAISFDDLESDWKDKIYDMVDSGITGDYFKANKECAVMKLYDLLKDYDKNDIHEEDEGDDK